MKRNLNAKTVAYLRRNGHMAAVVEHYNARSRRKADLFGFIDVIAVSGDGETVFLQVTSMSHVSDRLKKMSSPPVLANAIALCERAGVMILGWPPAGDRRPPRMTSVTPAMLTGASSAKIDTGTLLSRVLRALQVEIRESYVLVDFGAGGDVARRIWADTGIESHVMEWVEDGLEIVVPKWREASSVAELPKSGRKEVE